MLYTRRVSSVCIRPCYTSYITRNCTGSNMRFWLSEEITLFIIAAVIEETRNWQTDLYNRAAISAVARNIAIYCLKTLELLLEVACLIVGCILTYGRVLFESFSRRRKWPWKPLEGTKRFTTLSKYWRINKTREKFLKIY